MGSSSSTNNGPISDDQFNAQTEAATVAQYYAAQCQDRNVVITGGNSGLGLETARVLSLNGADVIICSRSVDNGNQAVQKIKAEFPAAKVQTMQLDLSSLASIEKFVKELKATNRPLHILINNAGIMGCPLEKTVDGFESQLGTNHIGHFHLTSLLLPLLKSSSTKDRPSRVVNLSSLANYVFPTAVGIDLDNLDGSKGYEAYTRYGESKLANILFTRELQNRLNAEPNNSVQVVSLHPGVIAGTNLLRHLSASIALSLTWTLLTSSSSWSAVGSLVTEPQKSIAQGSSTTVRCALDPKIIPGEHYANCAVSDLVHPMGLNADLQKSFWEATERLIAEAKSKK